MTSKLVRGIRIAWTISAIIVVESLVIGLSALPAVGTWSWLSNLRVWEPAFLNTMVLAVSLVPAFLVFSCGLMFLTAFFCRLLGWRTPEGEHSLRDLDPALLTWVKYNAVAHVVRVICGELFRATPIWRYYIQAMGAKVGNGVHINTAALYDINLFTLEDHVVIGGRAQLSAHLVEAGYLKAAPVIFRRAATIGTGSIVSPGVEVGEHGSVGALSFVTKYTKVPPYTAYGGVPAKFIKEFEERPVSDDELLYREPGVQ